MLNKILYTLHLAIKKLLKIIHFQRSPHNENKPIVYQKVCSQCARPVVPEVVAYCLRHPSRFEGKIYCKEHQYPFFNNMPGLENQLEKQAKIFAKE